MKIPIFAIIFALLSAPAFALMDTGWNGTLYGGPQFKYWSGEVFSLGDVSLGNSYDTNDWQNVTVMKITGPGAAECYFGYTAFDMSMYATTPARNAMLIAGRRGPGNCTLWVASNLGKVNADFAGSITLNDADLRNITVF